MGDEPKFSEKWDFRRKENKFDDSSSDDDPDSNPNKNPIIHNPNPVHEPSQLENGTDTVTRKQPPKPRKRRTKKDESKPEKAKQVRVRKPKTVCAKETKKEEETVCAEENKEKEETVTPTDDVGMFVNTLIDDLTASRESLMDWMKTELYGPEQNVVSRPPVKKRAVTTVAAQRSVKKRMTKKKKEEEEKESQKQRNLDNISQEMNKPKEIAQNSGDQVPVPDCNAGPLDSYHRSSPDTNKSKETAQNGIDQVPALDCNVGPLYNYLRSCQEMNKTKEIAQSDGDQVQDLACNGGPLNRRSQEINKRKEIVQNGGDEVQELECNVGPLNRFLKSGQDSLGRNYFQQQQQGQERIAARTEMENEKNETATNQKSVVLAIKAPILSEKQKQTREANNIKNRSLMVERTGSETQKDHNFVIPYVPSYPVASSLFPSSSQGISSFASYNNFQLRQPPDVSQITDLSEFQTGFTGGQGFGNSMFNNNGYLSGFPAAFQPNLIPGGYNFLAQANPAPTLQQRGNNNMFGGLRIAGGAISFLDGRFPEPEVGNSNNGLSDYRTSSGR